jgi:hypothetical protein
VATPDGAAVAFSARTIRFVPAAGGRTCIVGVHATDRTNTPGRTGNLCNTLIRFA